jgi:hypothetical protein
MIPINFDYYGDDNWISKPVFNFPISIIELEIPFMKD